MASRDRDMPPERGTTPGQLARRYGVGIHKVLAWIKASELRAVNVARDMRKRPQWSILPEALADFERRRAATPQARAQRKPRRKDPNVIEYF